MLDIFEKNHNKWLQQCNILITGDATQQEYTDSQLFGKFINVT